MAALPPPPPGPPVGGPPPGPPMGGPPMEGPPPGAEISPSPEEIDQLVSMLMTLPPEVLQEIVTELNAAIAGGGPAGPGEPGPPVGPDAMREAATARAGI